MCLGLRHSAIRFSYVIKLLEGNNLQFLELFQILVDLGELPATYLSWLVFWGYNKEVREFH